MGIVSVVVVGAGIAGLACARVLVDAGVDVVKIKELMGHASIVTTMRYIHATDQGKRGAITILSEYRQQRRHKFVTNEKRQAVNLP